MNDTMENAVAKQNIAMVGAIKKMTLILVEKWRKMREANDYAMRFYKPKLIVR